MASVVGDPAVHCGLAPDVFVADQDRSLRRRDSRGALMAKCSARAILTGREARTTRRLTIATAARVDLTTDSLATPLAAGKDAPIFALIDSMACDSRLADASDRGPGGARRLRAAA